MKDPVSRGLVLPPTRFERITHDGYGSGTAYPLRRLRGLRKAEHPMAPSHQHLDQLCADESGISRNKRRGSCAIRHVMSVAGGRARHHRQHPHRDRTMLVQSRQ